jgi:hypothetical protein
MDELTRKLALQYALHRNALDIPMPTDIMPDGTMGPDVNQPPVQDKMVEHMLRQMLARRIYAIQKYGTPRRGAWITRNPYIGPLPEIHDGVYRR